MKEWVLATVVSTVASGCFFKPEPPGGGPRDDGGTSDGDGSQSTTDAFDGANYMFVTSTPYLASTLTSAAVVDGHCRTAATTGGLPGTFVAWWSTGAGTITHARSRLQGSRGWIRPDKQPFADTLEKMLQGVIYTPPRINELGNDQWQELPELLVYTGTDASGMATGNDCGVMGNVTVGVLNATREHWTNEGNTAPCDGLLHLYCFGTDNDVEVVPAPPQTSDKLAFVTSTTAPNGMGGFNGACASAGGTLKPGASFVAFVADGTPARSKLPANPNGWYRPDGVKLVADRNFTTFTIPLNVSETLNYHVGTVYAGSSSFDTAAQGQTSCANWTSPSGMYIAGQMHRSERDAWASITNYPCVSNSHVYCFEN